MNNVIIYDGKCNMCSTFIKFLVKFNKNKNIYFTDFESEWSKRNLPLRFKDKKSIVYLKDNSFFVYSDAIIFCISDMRSMFKPILILRLIHSSIRNTIYKVIAKYRYIFNSSKSTCILPSKRFWNMYLK